MPCIASPQIYWSMQKKKIVRRENNEPTSYGKQTAFLFQTASLYSTGQTARSNTATAATSCPASAEANPGGKRKPLTKIGSAKYVRPSNRFQCIHPGTVPAAKQTVPAAAGGGSKTSSAPKDSQAIPPGYYRPIPRKQRADYQYLAKRSLSSKGSAAVLFSFLFCSVFSELVLLGNLGLSVLILT